MVQPDELSCFAFAGASVAVGELVGRTSSEGIRQALRADIER
jgi:hypothetical protein